MYNESIKRGDEMKKLFAGMLVAVLCLTAGFSPMAHAAGYVYETVSSTGGNLLASNGDAFVWVEPQYAFPDGSVGNALMYYDGSSSRVITPTPTASYQGVVMSSQRIVYVVYGPSNTTQIFSYDIATNTTTQITNDQTDKRQINMLGNQLVWSEGTGDANTVRNIYLYDFDTLNITAITSNAYPGPSSGNPVLTPGEVYWADDQNNITKLDLSSGQRTIIESGRMVDSIVTDGSSSIAWIARRDPPNGSYSDVYLYNGQSVVQVSNDNDVDMYLQLKGNYVVWNGGNPNDDIDVYTISTGATTVIATGGCGAPTTDSSRVLYACPTGAVDQYGGQIMQSYVRDVATGTTTTVPFPRPTTATFSVMGPTLFASGNSGVLVARPNPDNTPPTVSNFAWTTNPRKVGQDTTFTVSAADGQESGVKGGEYFIGDTDPGVGKATQMTWDGTSLNATIVNSGLQAGIYKVSVRAVDNADNWSTLLSDYMVVYDPSGQTVTASKTTSVPSLANGDILPGLTQAGQTNKATFAFKVFYDSATQNVSGQSTFSFSYSTGTCGNKPVNCTTLAISAPSFAWFVTDAQGNAVSTFQGTATVTINGTATSNPFRVVATDGNKTTPTTTDKVSVKIYSPGANPNTATPIYQINDPISAGAIAIQ